MSRFFQGYYDSSDDGVMDDDGFVSIMARSDDVINVSGHRISTKALEEVGEVSFAQEVDSVETSFGVQLTS